MVGLIKKKGSAILKWSYKILSVPEGWIDQRKWSASWRKFFQGSRLKDREMENNHQNKISDSKKIRSSRRSNNFHEKKSHALQSGITRRLCRSRRRIVQQFYGIEIAGKRNSGLCTRWFVHKAEFHSSPVHLPECHWRLTKA